MESTRGYWSYLKGRLGRGDSKYYKFYLILIPFGVSLFFIPVGGLHCILLIMWILLLAFGVADLMGGEPLFCKPVMDFLWYDYKEQDGRD